MRTPSGRLFIVFFLCFFFAPKAFGENATLRVAVFPLQPLNFIDAEGRASGLYPDLIRTIAQKHDWKIIFVPGNWAEAMQKVKNGEIDLLTTVAYSSERAKKLEFSREAVIDIWGQVFIPPASPISNFLDLAGKKVGVMHKDINAANFISTEKQFGITSKIIEFPTHDKVFEAVSSGHVDAGVAPQHFGFRNARSYGLVASTIQFAPFSVYFAAAKGKHREVLQIIDSQLHRWKQDKDSFYYQRVSHWIAGKNYEKKIIPQWLLITLTLVTLFFVVTFYTNRLLNLKVKQRTAQLLTSEEKYRSLIESVNSIILRIDENGKAVFINSYGRMLLGYAPEDIIGSSAMHLVYQDPRNLSYPDEVKSIPPPAFPIEQNQLVESEVECKNGGKKYIQWSNRAILDNEGKVCELFCVGTDITRQKRLETELYQSQKTKALGTLAGGIAHDFNNILSVIMGGIELADLRRHEPRQVVQQLNKAKIAVQRAKDLVSQILTFSRKSDTKQKTIQPAKIIQETLKMLRSVIPSTIGIEQDLLSEKKILGDPTHLHQIVMNLCTNAYHAVDSDNGKIRISLTDVVVSPEDRRRHTQRDLSPGEYVLLQVEDNGCGMDEHTQHKVFDPYFTTKPEDKGTGLGLAVVQGIVKEHRGSIAIESERGKGSCISIHLPVINHAGEESSKQQEDPLQGGRESILIVDDEQAIAELFGQVLNQYGYSTTVFYNSFDALQEFRLAAENYDLVITDMTMPNLTGRVFAGKILEIRPNMPIILCTGYSSSTNMEEAVDIGISGFLEKPVAVPDLLKMIRTILD